MKKRMIAVWLMLMVLLSGSASAEAFVIRNGITWGMSPEEVTAVEGKEYLSGEVGNGYRVYHFPNKIAEQLKDIEGVDDYTGDPADFSALMKWIRQADGYIANLAYYFEAEKLFLVICVASDWKPEAQEHVINKLNEQVGACSEGKTEDLKTLMEFLDPRSSTPGFITNVKYWDANGTDIWYFESLGTPMLMYIDSTYGQPAAEVYDLTGL